MSGLSAPKGCIGKMMKEDFFGGRKARSRTRKRNHTQEYFNIRFRFRVSSFISDRLAVKPIAKTAQPFTKPTVLPSGSAKSANVTMFGISVVGMIVLPPKLSIFFR